MRKEIKMESLISYICREMDRQDRFFRHLCRFCASSNKRINRLSAALLMMNAVMLMQAQRISALEAEMRKYSKENEKVGD